VDHPGVGYVRAIARSASPRRSLGEALSLRDNSLNFLRLVLATFVIVSHVYDTSGLQIAIFHNGNLGTLSVYGFFGISGYLIARSAEHHGIARFLWLRAVRIFPGFWMALIMTAVVFGSVAWLIVHHGTPRAGLGNYFFPPYRDWPPVTSPLNYILNNWWLQMRQIWIGGVMTNASLWTLYFEFICYLVLAGLSLIRVLRRPLLVLALTGLLYATIAAISMAPSSDKHFNVYLNWVPMNIMKFLAVFLVGTLLYLYRDKVRDSGWLALGCAAITYGSLFLVSSTEQFAFHISLVDLVLPAMVYPVLWLGAHLPFQRFGSVNDYSYGVYLYGFPSQVIIMTWLGRHWPRPVVLVLTLVLTVPFALASWWLVERNALRLRSLRLRRRQLPEAEAA
jgi:peptidoglycan/LPS O-acetylase OafA/YrhL